MDVGSTVKLVGGVISIARRFSSIPFKWNSKSLRVEMITEKREIHRWVTISSIFISLQILAVVSFAIRLGDLNIAKVEDALSALTPMIFLLSLSFEFHLIWKMEEIKTSINALLGFVLQLSSEHIII